MMQKIFSAPYRVYLCALGLLILGLWSGLNLPVSLYPQNEKPTIGVWVDYGHLTADEFYRQYGRNIESQLSNISNDGLEVENVTANYRASEFSARVIFKWGSSSQKAISEVRTIMNTLSSGWPKQMQNNMWVWFATDNGGFLAISFFSEKRDPNELYDLLDPILTPQLSGIKDVSKAFIWNPKEEEIRLDLKADSLTSLGLFPSDIERSFNNALNTYNSGQIKAGSKDLNIQMPSRLKSMEDLERLYIQTPNHQYVPLSQISRVSTAPSSTNSQVFKVNGQPGLILHASPKSGGNIKRMSEDIIEVVKKSMPLLPDDIQYRILVDPSAFIRSAITNLMHEVMMAAGIAVLILFLFIGSLRNTITAAIEIPLSMVLAFLCMKLTNMNINLISLGGLALSAGMNVDASVVVMENIFRHFKEANKNGHTPNAQERFSILWKAVREVISPVMVSTLISLIVFIPLAFTSDLTNAILGDLAKAVIFSHGFSAIVAFILVPTIRLHLMGRSNGKDLSYRSPIESYLHKLEETYACLLVKFINSTKAKWIICLSGMAILFVLVQLALPRLPHEIVGKPDTDWVVLGINSSNNRFVKQMEDTAAQTEELMLKK